MVQIQFDIPPELNKKLRLLCVERDIMDKRQGIIVIIEEYFKRKEKI